MLESGHPPSLVDIERLLKIKRQLDALETIELRARARAQRGMRTYDVGLAERRPGRRAG